MPIKSKAQHGLMRAAADGKAAIGGLSKEVANKYIRETPKKKLSMFAKGK